MKLKEKISWLMGCVQRSLLPHLDECLDTFLTEQEQCLVTMLEIVQVERYVPKKSTTQRLGRKLLERESLLARAFVAKAVYRLPTTSDLIRALRVTSNLRRICGFIALGDIPSESTFSRAFTDFAASGLANRAHDALVQDYLAGELIGHISQDSTAIVGREKPAKKVKKPKRHAREAVLLRTNNGSRLLRNDLTVRLVSPQRRPSVNCHPPATEAQRRMPRDTKRPGTGTSCI